MANELVRSKVDVWYAATELDAPAKDKTISPVELDKAARAVELVSATGTVVDGEPI